MLHKYLTRIYPHLCYIQPHPTTCTGLPGLFVEYCWTLLNHLCQVCQGTKPQRGGPLSIGGRNPANELWCFHHLNSSVGDAVHKWYGHEVHVLIHYSIQYLCVYIYTHIYVFVYLYS